MKDFEVIHIKEHRVCIDEAHGTDVVYLPEHKTFFLTQAGIVEPLRLEFPIEEDIVFWGVPVAKETLDRCKEILTRDDLI